MNYIGTSDVGNGETAETPNNAVTIAATPLCIDGFRRCSVHRSHGNNGI